MPAFRSFKPAGVPAYDLDEVILTVEELEALRLKDILELDQQQCADFMGVSRPTFQRILKEARRKVAEALWKGQAITIEGGTFEILQGHRTCRRCEYSLVPPGLKVCPKCGFEMPPDD